MQEKYSTLRAVDNPDIGKAEVGIISLGGGQIHSSLFLDHDSKYPAPEDEPHRLPKYNTTIAILHLMFL